MTRTPQRVTLAVVFSALFIAALPRWNGPPAQEDVAISTTAVAGPVHMLQGNGGNIGVSVGSDGVLMIDDQFANLAPKLQATIDALAGGPRKPRYLINTHVHPDHTGGNTFFGAAATVIAHENVRQRLVENRQDPMPATGLPVVTFRSTISVWFNGEQIQLTHYPRCHTDGDTVVWFTGSNVLHLGDLFFNGLFPFVDLSSGGSVTRLERSVADLLTRLPSDAKLIPGHGPLATVDDLKRYDAMLVDTLAIVRRALDAGKNADEIVDDGLLADYESLSWSFISTEKYVRTLVAELSATAADRR